MDNINRIDAIDHIQMMETLHQFNATKSYDEEGLT